MCTARSEKGLKPVLRNTHDPHITVHFHPVRLTLQNTLQIQGSCISQRDSYRTQHCRRIKYYFLVLLPIPTSCELHGRKND